ncbi:MAG: thioredoxin fold domain-containing protein [Betaproteobacteria bacterium]
MPPAAFAAGATGAPAGHRFNLPAAHDLGSDGIRSAAERIPVLLFFDRSDCPYCERALREFLVPMANNAEWAARAVYRQVEIDGAEPLVDFAGTPTTHREFAGRHHIRLTPTIYVVDGHGNPLGRPLVGLMTVDFYGAYLEEAISAATARLRGSSESKS